MPTQSEPESSRATSAVVGQPDGQNAELNGRRGRFKRLLKVLGPGLITGASDDDPSGIGTYAVTGAQLGYASLWTALITFPLMTAVQYICAKIGLVSGSGIATVLRQHYPRWLLKTVVIGLVVANTINAGADMLAIAAGVNLLLPVSILALAVPIGLLILALQVFGSYRLIVKTFKWLTLSLFMFIVAAFMAKPNWTAVLKGTLLPTIRFDATTLSALVAVLGTTISPYLFFWQANQEVEEKIARGRKQLWQRKGATPGELQYAAWDVSIGMLLSNVVMYFIILATAATGQTDINSAEDAAEALRPVAGNAATVLMALGLIGTGVLAVPILTGSAAYAVCEMLGWKCSLDAKPGQAREFYLVLSAATIGGLIIDLIGVNPIDALFWTAVINGFLSPPLLVVIMLISNNRVVMGSRVNRPLTNILGWATTVLMFAAAIALVATWT